MNEGSICLMVQGLVLIELQLISALLCNRRARRFGIAFDAVINHRKAYIAVNVIVCVNYKMVNIHLLTVSVSDRYTGAL